MRNVRAVHAGRVYAAAAGVLALAASLGAATAAWAVPEAVVVRQSNRMFVPAFLSVALSTPIRFVNDDKVLHHAYVDAPGFVADSRDIEPGSTATLMFDKAGRFTVRCAIHPKMRVDVLVST